MIDHGYIELLQDELAKLLTEMQQDFGPELCDEDLEEDLEGAFYWEMSYAISTARNALQQRIDARRMELWKANQA